ncbi:antitoxin HicB [Candidatus Roizmanbacteria bacterium RIFCSPHIGHO2_01_FULL_35_10]|uniref:Antitoxin HicB n=1 Tax=Candidatus Roizmanbacteria bacterium RIFCSPLOWO2_01_FULL_35_13 TaxID=1802055 RepID=A0A1F7I7K7_9BACT|nr:MAG: antitoxin HicB [Candidatus Roizmanbacteria bacterium RIFCSPHIGHO2_01_FULL_35_10]OGK39355.1 MAG: antitoxin HicB [Candidatus Roizmanbacteria bacterium RIFCSPLOWO2_01_FULL_35_13]
MKKTKSKKILKYDVVFEEAEEGGYTVYVPALPGCISEGDTFEKAKKNIKDAITLYLESIEIDRKSALNDTIFYAL